MQLDIIFFLQKQYFVKAKTVATYEASEAIASPKIPKHNNFIYMYTYKHTS